MNYEEPETVEEFIAQNIRSKEDKNITLKKNEFESDDEFFSATEEDYEEDINESVETEFTSNQNSTNDQSSIDVPEYIFESENESEEEQVNDEIINEDKYHVQNHSTNKSFRKGPKNQNIPKFLTKKLISLDKPRRKNHNKVETYSDERRQVLNNDIKKRKLPAEKGVVFTEDWAIPRNLGEKTRAGLTTITNRNDPVSKRTRGYKNKRISRIGTSKIRAIYYKDAISNNRNLREKSKYMAAYKTELNNLVKNNVYDPQIQISKEKIEKEKVVPINSLFTVKRDGTYKARIVARGDLQHYTSFNSTDTALLSMESLKLFLSMALDADLHVRTMDISHAFLYAPIEEELYIIHPNNRGSITPLKRALYGLKQSPKNWNDTLRQFLNKFDFYDTEHSPGLFISRDKRKMIAAYVDDTLIAAKNEKEIDEIIKMFKKRFDLKIIGTMKNKKLCTDILGLDLAYDLQNNVATLSLESYIKNMETGYPEITKKKPEEVPHKCKYDFNPKRDKIDSENNQEIEKRIKYCQKITGQLTYLRSRGRMDLGFATAKISRLVQNPHSKVIKGAEKILRYLFAHKSIKTRFVKNTKNNPTITVLTDASNGTEFDDKSRAGIHIWYGENLFLSVSEKSGSVYTSSTEAELWAIYQGLIEALSLQRKIEEIKGYKPGIRIITDSKPSLDILRTIYSKPSQRMIGLKISSIKEIIRKNDAEMRKINSQDNVADQLTKPVSKQDFKELVKVIEGYITPKDLIPMTSQVNLVREVKTEVEPR